MRRIPIFGFPLVHDVFEAELRGMAIFFAMELVDRTVELIHLLRVPIAHLGLTLRTPVGPESQFCIAIPIGMLIG